MMSGGKVIQAAGNAVAANDVKTVAHAEFVAITNGRAPEAAPAKSGSAFAVANNAFSKFAGTAAVRAGVTADRVDDRSAAFVDRLNQVPFPVACNMLAELIGSCERDS